MKTTKAMGKFSIPLQSEVVKYIHSKMKWPEAFCNHYAEKFWNHYQASGWKLSSGNAIKDWKACFNAQWQTLKFKEDIELLNKMQGVKTNGQNSPQNDFDRLDAFIIEIRKPGASIPFEDYGKWYEFMKGNKLLRPFSRDEVEQIKECYPHDNNKCRCAVVKQTLSGYVSNEITIKDILRIRNL